MTKPIDLTSIKNSELAIKAIEWMKENVDVKLSETYYLFEVTSDDSLSAIIAIHQDPNKVTLDYFMSTELNNVLYFTNNQAYYDGFAKQFGILDKAVYLGDFPEIVFPYTEVWGDKQIKERQQYNPLNSQLPFVDQITPYKKGDS